MLALLLSVALAVGIGLFPRISDDIGFSMYFRRWAGDGTAYFYWSWDLFAERLHALSTGEKLRVANILMLLFSTCPRWIMASVSAGACYLILVCGARMAGLKDRQLLPWTLWMAYFVLLLPWQDQLYLIAFQANYIWSGALLLIYIRLLFAGKKRPRPWLAFAVGLLLGAWHEGCGVTMAGAVVAVMLLQRRWRDKALLCALAGLCLGTAWLMAWPGFWAVSEMDGYFASRQIFYLPFLLPILVFVVLLAARWHRYAHDSLMTALGAVAVLSGALTVYSAFGARVGIPGILASGVGLLYVYGSKKSSRRPRVVAWTIFAVVMTHVVSVDAMCLRLRQEMQTTLDRYGRHPGVTVFAPMTLLEDSPWWLLGKPYYNWWAHSKCVTLLQYWADIRFQPMLVVPEGLKDFSPDLAEPIKGCPGYYAYRGYIVGPGTERDVARITCDYGRGPRPYAFYRVPFANASGHWAWHHPDNTYPETVLRRIPLLITCDKADTEGAEPKQ